MLSDRPVTPVSHEVDRRRQTTSCNKVSPLLGDRFININASSGDLILLTLAGPIPLEWLDRKRSLTKSIITRRTPE